MEPKVLEMILVSFNLTCPNILYSLVQNGWITVYPKQWTFFCCYRTPPLTLLLVTMCGIMYSKTIAWDCVVFVHIMAVVPPVNFLIVHVSSKWLDRHVRNLGAAVVRLRRMQMAFYCLDPLQYCEQRFEWLNSVDYFQRTAERIRIGYYMCGMNILKGRSFNSKASEELNRANELLRRGDRLLHPQEQLRGTMNFYRKKVLDFIKDTSPKSEMLGIWGMGGVGKSSLLKLVCDSRSEYGGDASLKVMFVRAGIGCTVGQVQEAIANSMGLTLEGNEASQAKIIHDHLKDTSFLLMLDDLWGYIDLKAVGIPLPLGSAGVLERQIRRKVVLATRNMDLSHKMGCYLHNTFQMECFYEEDAWRINRLVVDETLPEKKSSNKLVLEKPSGDDIAVQGDELLLEKQPGHVVAEKTLMMPYFSQGNKFSSEKPSSSSGTKVQFVRTQPYTVLDGRLPGVTCTYRRVRDFIEARGPNLLGVWGTRGVGKTALLRVVRDTYMGIAWFDHIMLVGAGTGSMVNNVQHAIAISLGFNLAMMSSMDEPSRARYISDYLRHSSYLLLLDDIREPINWKSVGLPTLTPRHKIILATRSRAACALMYCPAVDTIEMKCLGKSDAWHLFKDKAGLGLIDDHCQVIYHLAEQMVSMCGGLPLALCALGRAMSNKTDPREWRSAYSQLTAMRLEPRTIDGTVAALILNPHLVPPTTDKQVSIESANTVLSDERIQVSHHRAPTEGFQGEAAHRRETKDERGKSTGKGVPPIRQQSLSSKGVPLARAQSSSIKVVPPLRQQAFSSKGGPQAPSGKSGPTHFLAKGSHLPGDSQRGKG